VQNEKYLRRSLLYVCVVIRSEVILRTEAIPRRHIGSCIARRAQTFFGVARQAQSPGARRALRSDSWVRRM